MSTIKSSSEHLTLNADGASKDIKFQANGVEKASIDSSGNLTVSGNLTSVGIDDNADATAITINSDESVSFANAVVITDTINAGSSGSSGGTTGKINFGGVSGSIDGFTITNENGNYLNIKPNSSSNGIKILNTGGMCFGTDTATANALDDYEEGTWTPDLQFGTSNSGITYSSRAGRYTKIGDVVHVMFRCYLTSKGSSTGHARLTGFPYSIATVTGGVFHSISSRGQIGSNDEPMYLYMESSYGTSPKFYMNDWDGSGNSAVNQGEFQNNSEIEACFTYYTNS